MLYLLYSVKWLFHFSSQNVPHQLAFCFCNKGWPNLKQSWLANLVVTLLEFGLDKFVELIARHVGLKLHCLAASCPKNTAIPAVVLTSPCTCIRRRPIEIPPDFIVVIFIAPTNPAKLVLNAHDIPFSLFTIIVRSNPGQSARNTSALYPQLSLPPPPVLVCMPISFIISFAG